MHTEACKRSEAFKYVYVVVKILTKKTVPLNSFKALQYKNLMLKKDLKKKN